MSNVPQKDDFPLPGYEDLQSSTQFVIGEALRRGVRVEVLSRHDNIIRLTRGDVVEIVQEATMTSRDSYITGLLLDNKEVMKVLLREANIRVPGGSTYCTKEGALEDFDDFSSGQIVVKPTTANYGLGVRLFQNAFTRSEFTEALQLAFSYAKSVIVEEFLQGLEYRFLVIGGELIAIAHRRPANVIGDGERSVSELIDEKNSDHRRGEQYRKPLHRIHLGEVERRMLKSQGCTPESVPAKGQEVFLRKNSNLSTGGDSIDVTDEMHASYKEIAEESAKLLDASITGIDIIIQDLHQPAPESNYGIIELNRNPGLSSHRYPYTGTPRYVEQPILDLLGFPST